MRLFQYTFHTQSQRYILNIYIYIYLGRVHSNNEVEVHTRCANDKSGTLSIYSSSDWRELPSRENHTFISFLFSIIYVIPWAIYANKRQIYIYKYKNIYIRILRCIYCIYICAFYIPVYIIYEAYTWCIFFFFYVRVLNSTSFFFFVHARMCINGWMFRKSQKFSIVEFLWLETFGIFIYV